MPKSLALARPVALTPERHLKTLVENRTVYNFRQCELNIFETHQASAQVPLVFRDVVFTTMLRGKKVMHVPGAAPFDYLPGESVILPETAPMIIDFPEATPDNPTQCVALEIDREKIKQTLGWLNEQVPRLAESGPWRIEPTQFHIANSEDLANAVSRLIRIPSEHALTQDALADLTLQELLLRLLQTQAAALLIEQAALLQTSNRFAAVVQYIREHIAEPIPVSKLAALACMSKPHFFRSFKRELGVSPLDFILQERIRLAKESLRNPGVTITEVCYQTGFNNLTHFTMQFKRMAGMTPSGFRKRSGVA